MTEADEARVAAVAANFADAIDAAIPGWIERVTAARVTAAGMELTDDVAARLHLAGAATLASVGPIVRRVVTADVDAGAGNPLAVLRDGLGPATEALRSLGIRPLERDEFDVRNFPHDVFGLGPASFAEVDEDLVRPGVVWGAARAHVHLRRRAGE